MLQDCKPGESFLGILLVTEWKEQDFRQKTGSYLVLNCQDKSGSLAAKIWESNPQIKAWLKEYDVFEVKANVNEYRGIVELAIDNLRPVPPAQIDLSQLLPCSPYEETELEQRLQNLVQKVKEPVLNTLLSRVLNHAEIGKAYREAPAAKKVHQAYLRGLWEHSVKVAELGLSICANYPEVNLDLIITGALLHDIGKIVEYNYERGIELTNDGRLLGHIIIGVELLGREIGNIQNFPADLKLKLLHLITSHHGRYEWQSPKRPKLMEAFIIHYADLMESELWQFKQAKEDHADDEWSPYLQSLERYVYLK